MSIAGSTIEPIPDDDPLSRAMVAARSDAKGRDGSEEECVRYDTIDPDALDRMFREGTEGDTIEVEFTTHDAIVIDWGNATANVGVQGLADDPNNG